MIKTVIIDDEVNAQNLLEKKRCTSTFRINSILPPSADR